MYNTDLFRGYEKAWHNFIKKINDLCGAISISPSSTSQYTKIFGKDALTVFKRAQAISGFGAAVGRLKDLALIDGFDDVFQRTKGLTISDPQAFLEKINNNLIWLQDNTKKIGNAQRAYFKYFFRELYNKESDSYQKPEEAANWALYKYKTQNI